jgi:hypothetical protein
MSQEKVNKYKEEKANRKKILKKQKIKKILFRFVFAVIAIAIAVFLGWSIYDLVA